MAAVVILGTAGIVYSRDQRQPDNTRPLAAAAGRPVDHWHAAIGFYECGAFTPNLPEGNDPLGIHGHGDNVVHIHPFGASSSGKRAKLSIFFDSVGAKISASRIELPGQPTKKNGDGCDNGPGTVVTKVWDTRSPTDPGRIVPGNPGDIRPTDGMLITIGFVPGGTDLPKPPSEANLDKLSDVGPQATDSIPSTTIDPSSTSSTIPATTTTGASPTTSTSQP
jgi:hypothetical protein